MKKKQTSNSFLNDITHKGTIYYKFPVLNGLSAGELSRKETLQVGRPSTEPGVNPHRADTEPLVSERPKPMETDVMWCGVLCCVCVAYCVLFVCCVCIV